MQPAALSVSCLFFHLEIRELSQALRLFPSALSYLKLFHIFEGVPRQGRTKKQMTVCSLPPSRSPIVGLLLYCACILSVAPFVLKCKKHSSFVF